MHRISAFSSRNLKELLRDPLSFVFCLAFPLAMLAVMTLVDASIPAQAGMTIFRIGSLTPGVAVFGQTFVMLFTALTVSRDRTGSFLVRMYATPMNPADFVCGYALPMLGAAMAQAAVTCAAGFVIGLIRGVTLNPAGLLLCIVTLIPSALLMIALGLLFGTVFNEKSAPGLCSVIISLGSFLGGIWFDIESAGGVLLTIGKCFPFLYCVKAARSAVALRLTAEAWLTPLLITALFCAAVTAVACLAFRRRMRADLG